MGSEKRKEGLLLAVFWLAAVILIGTAANRLILHGPVGETLQKRETGWMLLELSVLFLWNLWWLCLAVKHMGKKKDGSSVSSIRVAVFPVGTQYIAAAHWCRHMDGNGDGIWYLHQ